MDLKEQTKILFSLCSVYVSWGLTDSIQAPFYPEVAISRGATVIEYGFVFGIIHLFMFLTGPILGLYMDVIGVRTLFAFGLISTGLCSLMFGLLEFVEDKTTFLVTSYILRSLEGVSEAASWTVIFVIILKFFPDNVATVYSIVEASFSFSEILGPTLGAFLFGLGGFKLPFIVCGSLCILTGVTAILIINKHFARIRETDGGIEQVATSPQESTERSKLLQDKMSPITMYSKGIDTVDMMKKNWYGPLDLVQSSKGCTGDTGKESFDGCGGKNQKMWDKLKLLARNKKRIILPLCQAMFAASVQSMLEVSLEPHLASQFHLRLSTIGLTFMFVSIPYFVTSPIFGYICDKILYPTYVQVIGSVFMIAGLLCIGPAPYITTYVMKTPQLSLTRDMEYILHVYGLALLGVGTSAGLVASFSRTEMGAEQLVETEDQRIFPLIAGVWTSAFAFGNFIGPSISSIVNHTMNFAWTAFVFQIICFILLILEFFNKLR